MSDPPAVLDASSPLLRVGETCGDMARARRVKLLVDGDEYFRTLSHSLVRAERQILITSWDLDPDVRLWRGDAPPPNSPPGPMWRPPRDLDPRLGPLLDELVRRQRRLRCLVLAWDFGTVFAVKRQLIPVFHLDWSSHHRVVVRLDSEHPFGACLHMKAVCVDDGVAWVGGIDLARLRWDRRGHPADEPLRMDPGGSPYAPWHDQQLMVDGEAAAMVGRFLRDRWLRATGRRVPAPHNTEGDPWPPGQVPDLREVDIGLLRTEPAWGGRPERREIEAAWLAAIARARGILYIENQYITARVIAEALARRLSEPDGPEIVIVTTFKSSGFLEQAAMDGRRAGFLEVLRQADRHGRLRVLYPSAGPELPIKVHAKALMVDDWYLQVGSANMANRSLGLDLELDLALEARGRYADETRRVLARHRDGLLAEHLGLPVEELRRLVQAEGSVRGALDRAMQREGYPRLLPLELDEPGLEVPELLGDPEHALDLTEFTRLLLPDGLPRTLLGRIMHALTALVLVASLEALWHGLPHNLAQDPTEMARWLRAPELEPVGLGAMFLAFVGASMVPFPTGVLVLLSGFAYGQGIGFALSLAGLSAGSLLGWGVGRLLGRRWVRSVRVPRMNALSRRLQTPGMIPVAELRLNPRHSFAEVNLVAGAMGTDPWDLIAGSVLGSAPGSLLMTALGAVLGLGLRQPTPLRLAGILVVLVLVAWVLLRLWQTPLLVRSP